MMIKSVTSNGDGTVTFEYCKLHLEYPNCVQCPLRSTTGYCMDWLKEEGVTDD